MEYTSRFPELGFYVDGVLKKFRNGRYDATAEEAKVLDGISDAVRVEVKAPTETAEKKATAKNSAK